MKLKAQLRFTVRWLIALVAILALLQPAAFASATGAVQKTGSCCKTCACCIERQAPSSNMPVAPPSSQRTSVQKDFQFVPLIAALAAPALETASFASVEPISLSAPAAAPLYKRHCSYLI
jgi:hypothetical protein